MTCERHTTANLLPLYRSDLVGPSYGGAWFSHELPHGWWCPVCDAETPDATGPELVLHLSGAKPTWSIRVLPSLALAVSMPDPLAGEELKKAVTAMEAAARNAKGRAERRERENLGQVGWRVTTEAGDVPVVWYWSGVNERRGCQLVAVRPRTKQACRICQTAIPEGHRCWRGDGAPARLHALERTHELRFCVKCIARLPQEPWTDQPATGARRDAPIRKVPMLRLVENEGA